MARALPRATPSTSTAAGSTCASPTTRTSRPSPTRPGSGSRGTGCTTRWVTVKGQKMGKSLGNALEVSRGRRGRHAARRALLPDRRALPLDHRVPRGLAARGRATVERIAGFLSASTVCVRSSGVERRSAATAFRDAMDDDLNVSGALAVVHDTVRAGNTALDDGDDDAAHEAAARGRGHDRGARGRTRSRRSGTTAGAGGADDALAALDALVADQLAARQSARAARDFEAADAIRDRLTAAGIAIEDTPSGARWSLARRKDRPDMPGNSQRRGAVRKSGEGRDRRAPAASGAKRLEGKGPTPKAAEREYHPAAKQGADRPRGGTSSAKPGYATGGRPQGRPAAGPAARAARQGVVRGRRRPQRRRRGAARRHPGDDDVRRRPDRRRRPRARGAQDRRPNAASPSSRPPAASWTGSPTAPSTRASRSRCRRTSTPTPATCVDPRGARHPAGRRARRGDRPAQPRRRGPVGRRVRRSRRAAARAPVGRDDGQRVEDVGRRRRPGARGPGPQPDPRARDVPEGRVLRRSASTWRVTSSCPGLALATEPVVVVVGSEGKGLSRLVRETCDQVVSIPMSSAVESLNAGVAAGVDAVRDRPAARGGALTRIPNRYPSRPGPPDHSRPDRLPWAPWRRARELTTSA